MEYNSLTMGTAASVPDNIAGKVNSFGDYLARLNNIASNAESIADRIGGSHPQPPSDKPGAPTPVPNGLGEAIARFMQAMSQYMDRIEQANSRTDRALG